jgi:hypothetical protein
MVDGDILGGHGGGLFQGESQGVWDVRVKYGLLVIVGT